MTEPPTVRLPLPSVLGVDRNRTSDEVSDEVVDGVATLDARGVTLKGFSYDLVEGTIRRGIV